MSCIVLTTFPAHRSKNVGDALITHSAVKILKKRHPSLDTTILFREEPLDSLSSDKRHDVLAPGFSVANGTYPTLFALFSDLDRMRHFWPVGCSFQSSIPGPDAFRAPYSKNTLEFLRLITSRWGPLPCRDELIVRRMHHFDLPAYYIGDLALYDEDKIGATPQLPTAPRSLAVTLGHHVRYLEQAIALAKKLNRQYPEIKKFVSLHGAPNPLSRTLEQRFKELGFESMHLYGPASGLDTYNNIDLHIGYRLHGHIHFLRNRKPSVLLVEDARSYGFSRSPGTSFGCIDAWDDKIGEPNDRAPEQALEFLTAQVAESFTYYRTLFDFVDGTFKDKVAPYFDYIAQQLRT